jgi:DUF2075 family protein
MEYGWLSDLPSFVQTEPRIIRQTVEDFLEDHNISQIRAWDSSIPIVQREGRYILSQDERSHKFTVILEYELPREGGRRPDVIILENGIVAVIEFKGKESASESDIDQVAAYARDLKNYHSECHELDVVPILVLSRSKSERSELHGVTILAPELLGKELVELCRKNVGPQIYPEKWTKGEYAPLPSLIQAAYLLFHNLPLPNIRKAESAKIPETVELITQIAHKASDTKTRHLVLLTGVPGSGKTLVGLQIAHEPKLNDLRVEVQGRKNGAPAVFLSGNGPLVEVLQDALHNTTFVQGMKKFIEYYAITRPSIIPLEHVIIFDEAQRAWDEKLVQEKHAINASEPSLLISIAERIPNWSVVLGLVGEGQEIHRGEEAGISQWAEALRKTNQSNWTVHCPPHLSNFFTSKNIHCTTEPLLNLTVSLRSHLAEDLHKWVEGVLSEPTENLPELQELAKKIIQAGYPLYITTDLEVIKKYARIRYQKFEDDKYGLLASRYAKNLESIGIDNKLHFERAKKLRVNRWFNAPSNDPESCCSLSRPATEFECQGLELDFSILVWGDDFIFDGKQWQSKMSVRKKVNDPHQMRKNAYRVLMTRGRDGICVYLPTHQFKEMLDTMKILQKCGMKELMMNEK